MSIKCPLCAFINFADAAACKRCREPLAAATSQQAFAPQSVTFPTSTKACPVCHHMLSIHAPTCPQCGHSYKSARHALLPKIALVLFLPGALLIALFNMLPSRSSSPAAPQVAVTTPQSEPVSSESPPWSAEMQSELLPEASEVKKGNQSLEAFHAKFLAAKAADIQRNFTRDGQRANISTSGAGNTVVTFDFYDETSLETIILMHTPKAQERMKAWGYKRMVVRVNGKGARVDTFDL